MSSVFAYRNGVLCAEDVPLDHLAAEIGTPFYVYSTAAIQKNYRAFSDALHGVNASICYAIKTCSNHAVMRALATCGAGALAESRRRKSFFPVSANGAMKLMLRCVSAFIRLMSSQFRNCS